MKNNKKIILETYDKNDLGENPIFQGGYINFGYWDKIDLQSKKLISQTERIEASMALYDQIYERLSISQEDEILEVGCGRGHGCKRIIEQHNIKFIKGIDISPNQIERAKQLYLNSPEKRLAGLDFKVSPCDKTPFMSEVFSKIFAVESPQHFNSLKKFAEESFRLLKNKGLLAFTAHFSTSLPSFEILKHHIPLINQGLDLLVPIDFVRSCFIESGFKEIEFKKIGEKVFEGFDRWSSQVGDAPWGSNFLKMYKENHLDYYILVFKKD